MAQASAEVSAKTPDYQPPRETSRRHVTPRMSRTKLGRAAAWVIEWFWAAGPSSKVLPAREGEPKPEALVALKLSDDLDIALLRSYVADCNALLDREEDRKKGIEARLASVLALSSVVTAIVVGVCWAAFDKGRSAASSWVAIAATAVTVYAVAQITRAVMCAVKGLASREYLEPSPEDVIPRAREDEASHLFRQLETYIECRWDHDVNNSAKASWMAAAHRSVENFMAALLVLVLVLSANGIWGAAPETAGSRVLAELRSDKALLELLRGPRGEPGPQGPKGLQGERGPTGECLPSPPRRGKRK